MAELTPEQEDALHWIVFAALPSKDGRLAVVEFAFPNEEAATYLFRMEEPWEAFLTLLNRALEATGLRREILSLRQERLHDEAKRRHPYGGHSDTGRSLSACAVYRAG